MPISAELTSFHCFCTRLLKHIKSGGGYTGVPLLENIDRDPPDEDLERQLANMAIGEGRDTLDLKNQIFKTNPKILQTWS